jgi:hypothetical protein
MIVSGGEITVASGATAVGAVAAAGALTVSAGVVTVAAGAAAAGAAAAAGGVLIVSVGALMVAAGTAAAAVQCTEIMFSSVTARLFSAVPALCPVRFTSWPTYALRSALLVVILNVLPVESSATV